MPRHARLKAPGSTVYVAAHYGPCCYRSKSVAMATQDQALAT
jgi:hypothetical protein